MSLGTLLCAARRHTTPPVPGELTGGTAIGDLTGNGGLAALFDGETVETAANAAVNASATGFGGKDWGAGVTHKVTRFDAWGSSDFGFTSSPGEPTINITLEGSSDNFAVVIDNLGSATGVADANGLQITKDGGLTQTAYRYHRLKITGGGDTLVAEIRFTGL
ncbi:MAG: hypothetical protein ACE5FM_02065 [Methyloligellaceae bacterium]